LNEQKQALIHQAVTRGLDLSVRLKPPGIEWLGDVPEHWKVSRLDRFITLQRGIDITTEQQVDGPIPVVSSGGISSFHNRFTSKGPGVLVGRKGTLGSVHYVETDYWAHDTTLWVKEFNCSSPRFVFYLLKDLDLKRFDTGSANPTLNRNVVHPEPVAFPPFDEQSSIASFLDQATAKIDSLIRHSSRQVDLAKEYRTRLIADVVTGKLDVRGVELPALDEPEILEYDKGQDGTDEDDVTDYYRIAKADE
ncbi:MAG: restriction endonuclease subunit S, partial [Dehalococcoidia bacterium]|nr:restriction endonuclease subunit S [Dehalococcoidia bacterium]